NLEEERWPSNHAGLDVDLGRERTMDWALVGDLQQARALLVAERARELHVALDEVQQALFRFAGLTVRSVDFRMSKSHSYRLERPLLASCVHRHGHGRAASEGREQEFVRIGADIGPSERGGFVPGQLMPAHGDLLSEAGRAAVDSHGARPLAG